MSGEMMERLAADPEAVTVGQALRIGQEYLEEAGVASARLDAELLLGKVLAAPREKLYLRLHGRMAADEPRELGELLLRRGRREPLAYILGEKEFWSLRFRVTRDVLVPRPETELLVETALGIIDQRLAGSETTVLDLATGSGAIAVSLAKEKKDIEVWATDISPAALEVARLNAALHNVQQRISFLAGDLFGPVEELRNRFHLVVSNPPYVTESELEGLAPEIRDWEPRLALYGGLDGLDFYRRIAREAPFYLADGGFVVVEIGDGMAGAVRSLFTAAGPYSTLRLCRDLAGRDRVIVAQISA
jgi:release factor glutamine methyltransferase